MNSFFSTKPERQRQEQTPVNILQSRNKNEMPKHLLDILHIHRNKIHYGKKKLPASKNKSVSVCKSNGMHILLGTFCGLTEGMLTRKIGPSYRLTSWVFWPYWCLHFVPLVQKQFGQDGGIIPLNLFGVSYITNTSALTEAVFRYLSISLWTCNYFFQTVLIYLQLPKQISYYQYHHVTTRQVQWNIK